LICSYKFFKVASNIDAVFFELDFKTKNTIEGMVMKIFDDLCINIELYNYFFHFKEKFPTLFSFFLFLYVYQGGDFIF